METFKNICRKTQEELKEYLFNELANTHGNNVIRTKNSGGFIYAQGTFPVLLVAHLDTVHKETPKEFNWDKKTKALSSPQGIGGDDRCGVYMILEIIKKYNCSVLFCEDEEIGGVGAKKFVDELENVEKKIGNKIDFNYIIEFDRMNGNDAVFYECDNPEFEMFITKDFYKKSYGTFSDISTIAPALGIAAVNLSCGYYKAHTKDEYVVLHEMEESINAAMSILERTDEKFEYIEAEYGYGYGYDFENYFLNGKDVYGVEKCYLFTFIDESGSEQWEYEIAHSQAEAIGMLLTEHRYMCFADIIDMDIEEDFEY